MKTPHIVILGAGYAGVRAARRLLASETELAITLIDQGENHQLMTNLHEVASGRIEAATLEIPLTAVFGNRPITLVRDRILAVDLATRRLTGVSAVYDFDQLIIAAGARSATSDVPGADRFSYPLDSLSAAVAIRRRVRDPQLERVIISGGGLTGVELAADLRSMQPDLAVTLVESRRILADQREDIRDYVTSCLVRTGVEILTDSRVTAVDAAGAWITPETGPAFHRPGMVIWTTGARSRWRESLADAHTPELEASLRLKNHPGVWVIGDAADPDWASVENSLQSADRAADNLLRDLAGQPALPYELKPRPQMIALGPGRGIATTRIPLKGWPAVVLKFLVDLVYLLRLAGIGPAVDYFNGHLVRPGHGRSLTGSLLSSRGQRLWLFPLRLYLGGLWLLEGFKKIIGPDQFAAAERLSDLLTIGPDSWLRQGNLHVPFAWLTGLDGISGATMGGTSGPIIEDLPWWYEAVMRTIMPTPTLAMFFQGILVWTEFAVGVALILGLFTWIAAFLSVAMTMNFFLSGVAGWQQLWILPASLALMAGAGHFLGLDAWVIPRIRQTLGIRSQ